MSYARTSLSAMVPLIVTSVRPSRLLDPPALTRFVDAADPPLVMSM